MAAALEGWEEDDGYQPVTKGRKLNRSPSSIEAEIKEEWKLLIDLEKEEKSPPTSSVITVSVNVPEILFSSSALEKLRQLPSPIDLEKSSSSSSVITTSSDRELSSSVNSSSVEPSPFVSTSDDTLEKLLPSGAVVVEQSKSSIDQESKESNEEEEVMDDDDDDDDEYDDDEDYKQGRSGDYFGWCPAGVRVKDEELWDKYFKEMHASQGYEIVSYPGLCGRVSIVPWDFDEDPEILEEFEEMCLECITHYNGCHEGEPKYKYAGIIDYVTAIPKHIWELYYITFEASQIDDSSIVETFRAEYFIGWTPPKRRKVILCELKRVHVAAAQKEKCPLPCCCPGIWTGNAEQY